MILGREFSARSARQLGVDFEALYGVFRLFGTAAHAQFRLLKVPSLFMLSVCLCDGLSVWLAGWLSVCL